MLSRTMYAIIIALFAMVLACALAGSCRVESFDEEPAPDVVDAGKLDAERLPPEDGEKKDRMANRVPAGEIPTEEEGAGADEPAPVTPREEESAPEEESEVPPPPPPASEGFSVEPFVGGMMARF